MEFAELLPAQVCVMDVQLKTTRSATCPACSQDARPVVDDRWPMHARGGLRVAFPCGHLFSASDAVLESAHGAVVEAEAAYYGWDSRV